MSVSGTTQTDCIWLVGIATIRCPPEDQNVALRQQRARLTHQGVYRPSRTDNSAPASIVTTVSDGLYTAPTVQISLSADKSATERPLVSSSTGMVEASRTFIMFVKCLFEVNSLQIPENLGPMRGWVRDFRAFFVRS